VFSEVNSAKRPGDQVLIGCLLRLITLHDGRFDCTLAQLLHHTIALELNSRAGPAASISEGAGLAPIYNANHEDTPNHISARRQHTLVGSVRPRA
jgi:hypothetical protein